jgi:hypothetical protein
MTLQDQFPASEFDSWAKNYDQSVQEDTNFPFVGYHRVLQEIVNLSGVSTSNSQYGAVDKGFAKYFLAQKRLESSAGPAVR